MCPTRTRPAGAANYLRLRRSIDEHLELRRMTWQEFAMFIWLCLKAEPHTGRVRTNWLILAQQSGLTADHVEKLCRSLRGKGYVDYPIHRGQRRVLLDVAIDKYPLSDGTYTALDRSDGRRGPNVLAEVPAEVLAEVSAEVPAELGTQRVMKSSDSIGGRSRERTRNRRIKSVSLRVRSADAVPVAVEASGVEGGRPRESADVLPRAEALAAAPAILRETVELFFLKTGRDGLGADELAALRDLERAHTPAAIQRAVTTAVDRFTRRGDSPAAITFHYVWDSLKHFTTRTGSAAPPDPVPARTYPDGVTRLYLTEDTHGRDPIAEGSHGPGPGGARREAPGAP